MELHLAPPRPTRESSRMASIGYTVFECPRRRSWLPQACRATTRPDLHIPPGRDRRSWETLALYFGRFRPHIPMPVTLNGLVGGAAKEGLVSTEMPLSHSHRLTRAPGPTAVPRHANAPNSELNANHVLRLPHSRYLHRAMASLLTHLLHFCSKLSKSPNRLTILSSNPVALLP